MFVMGKTSKKEKHNIHFYLTFELQNYIISLCQPWAFTETMNFQRIAEKALTYESVRVSYVVGGRGEQLPEFRFLLLLMS